MKGIEQLLTMMLEFGNPMKGFGAGNKHNLVIWHYHCSIV
jgi:hypothetical protein